MKFKLNLLANNLESDDFSNHFFGCPEIKTEWNENAIFNNDEVFLFQINLELIKHELLPNKGILSFFIATESHPFRGIVRYNDLSGETERIDFNVDAICNASLDQEFEMELSDEGEIELLGKNPKFKSYRPLNNEICLARLCLSNVKSIDLFKDIDEEICFMIDKNDLSKHDFSKAHLSLSLDE